MTAKTETIDTPIVTPRRVPWARLAAGFAAGILGAVLLVVAGLVIYEQAYDGRVKPGVHVGSVDLSGLDRPAAASRLTAAYAGLKDGRIVVRTLASGNVVTYAAIGRGLDVDRMLDAAFAVGRTGDPLSRAVDEVRTAFQGETIGPVVRLDMPALAHQLSVIAGVTDKPPVNASVSLKGGAFVVSPSVVGSGLDLVLAQQEVAAALASPDAPSTITVAGKYGPIDPTVTDTAAHMARLTAQQMSEPFTLAAGSERWTIPAATVRTWITFQTAGGTIVPVVAPTAPVAALKAIEPKIDKRPVEATFLFSREGSIVGATASADGRTLDVAKTARAVAQAMEARAAVGADVTAAVQIVSTTTHPRMTTAQAKAAAPLMTRISTWTTYYVPGPHNGNGANISIPAQAINGYVVAPGATFDFWRAIGPVTLAAGYKYGGAIVNGHSVEGAALAGGICSTSTTLFNAVMRAGYQMGARTNHYYYITRYPVGLDATVYESGGQVVTMSWTNDTAYPVLIRSITSWGLVRFDIYSVPTGRKVVLSKPTIWNYIRSTGTDYVPTTALAPGHTLQTEWPTDGFDASVTRWVYDASGTLIHQDTWTSHYAMMRGFIEYGVAPTPPPAPTPSPTPTPTPTP